MNHPRQLCSCWPLGILALLGAHAAAQPNLVLNGGFEDGWHGWTTTHAWYEQKRAGASQSSAWSLDGRTARAGIRAAKVVGNGNRGIAIQTLRIPPGSYRVSGWIRCQGLAGAEASILVEFLDAAGQWFKAVPVGKTGGASDWTFVAETVEFPNNVVTTHLDLLTSAPNHGTAWFDDIAVVPLSAGPPPSVTNLRQKPADAGEVALGWEVPSAGIARFEVFLEPRPFESLRGLEPRRVVDWTTREATLQVAASEAGLTAAVVPVGLDGQRPRRVNALAVTARDTRAPRPVDLTAHNSAVRPGALVLEWEPCLLDTDVAGFRLYEAGSRAGTGAGIKPVGARLDRAARSAWVARTVLEPATRFIGASAVDESGNESAPVWQPIPEAAVEPRGDSPAPPFSVWITSALHNVFRDTPPPAHAPAIIDLVAARNESECAQVVLRSAEPIESVRIEAEPLLHENGRSDIGPQYVVCNFVGYLRVETNSTATPADGLLRRAPADFPDPLREERAVELRPAENQPVFVRVDVPASAEPGRYRGGLQVVSAAGTRRVPIEVEVLPVTLPEKLPILVTTWFNTTHIAKFHKVPEWSEDDWRLLRVYARELRRAHQNVVFTPLELIKIWREPDGSLTFDFADFDRWVRLFDSEGVAERIELSHLGGRTTGEWECPTFSLSPRPATDRLRGVRFSVELEQFLPALQRHLEVRGWLPRTLLHVGDEPTRRNVASWREQSARVHRAAPALRRIDAIHVPAEEVRGQLEVLVPQLDYFTQWLPGYQEARRRDGAEIWFYIAWVPQGRFPNRLLDRPCIQTRLIHWINFLHDATGYLHWGLNWWTDFRNMGLAPGDNWIIYPGRWGPRSSLRWEAMRDGLEDFACFRMLADKSPERARALLREIMRSPTDYDQSPQRLEQTRRELLRTLAGLATKEGSNIEARPASNRAPP